jgi:putative DNA primase/helicase
MESPTTKSNGAAESAISTTPIVSLLPTKIVSTNGDGINQNPPRPTVDLSHFPSELKNERIWCTWRYETRDGKETKVPYRDLARKSDPSDPAAWTTLDAALANLANPNSTMSGIGCFASDGRVWTDLDDCVHDGFIEPWALEVVNKLGTYAEFSPSGKGIHCYSIGLIQTTNKTGNKINGCEMYGCGRYFTVTGKHIQGTPKTLKPSEHISAIHADLMADKLRPYQLVKDNKDGSKAEAKSSFVVSRPLAMSERDAKLQKALAGDLSDYSGDRSGAVHGVLQLLARKHKGDRDAMCDEFCASELRAMWGSKWDRLEDKELSKAIAEWEKNGEPSWEDHNSTWAAKPAEGEWRIEPMTAVEAKPIRWLWKGYVALGKLTTFNGEPGSAKSLIATDVAARVSTGRGFPFDSKNTLGAPCDVLFLTIEEDSADTVKPRFLAAGGDPRRLFRLTIGGQQGCFRFEDSVQKLEALIEQQPDIRLVIFDPIVDFIRAEQNKDQEVRAALNEIQRLAERLDFAVIGISHLNKKSDLAAIHRVSGARGFTGVARLNFLIGQGAEKDLRHLCNLKVNVAKEQPSLDFGIEEKRITDGLIISEPYPVVRWEGTGAATAEDITSSQRPDHKSTDTMEVDLWLSGQLEPRGTWKPSADVYAAGKLLAYDKRRLQRAAKRVKVEHRRVGMPSVGEMRLPELTGEAKVMADAIEGVL